jgi:uncharacterized protein YabN with tetrapyrrole methylase and pyrophosphatase domain
MILDQIKSECDEIKDAIQNSGAQERIQEEVSDLLHAAFSICIFSGFDLDETIKLASIKFHRRFIALQEIALEKGYSSLKGLPITALNELWQHAKVR